MLPEENKFLGKLADGILSNFAQAAVCFILYGAYFMVFVMSSRILFRQYFRTKGPKMVLLLALSVILFISTTLRTYSWISFIVIQVSGFLGTSDVSLKDRRMLVRGRLGKFDTMLAFGRSINLITSDLIAIWRAWVLYQAKGWVRLLLGSVFIINVGILLSVPALNARSKTTTSISSLTYANVLAASSFVSCATNVLATLFIALKALKHRQAMSHTLKQGTIDKVFRMLVETGLGFAVFQFIDAILAVLYIDSASVPTSRAWASGIFDEVVISLAAIYPVVVILIVQDNKTVVHKIVSRTDTQSIDDDRHTTIQFTTRNEMEGYIVQNEVVVPTDDGGLAKMKLAANDR